MTKHNDHPIIERINRAISGDDVVNNAWLVQTRNDVVMMLDELARLRRLFDENPRIEK